MRIMTGNFKKVECDPKCGFMIRSHDERELIEIVKQHAQKSHNMAVTEKDIKDKMVAA